MIEVKYLSWALALAAVLLGGCELNRQSPVTIEPFAADSTPPAATQSVASLETPTVTRQAPTAIVRVKAVPGQIQVGDYTTAEISVETEAAFTSLSLTLQFNPAQLQVRDTSQTTPATSETIVQQSVDNTAGIVLYALADTGAMVPDESGTISIAEFVLQAIGEGISELRITQLAISEQDVPVAATIENAQISIGPQSIVIATLPASPQPPPAEPAPPPETAPPSAIPPVGEIATPPATQPAVPIATAAVAPPSPPIIQPLYIPPDATVGFCYRVQPGETIETVCMNDARCQALPYRPSPFDINRTNDLNPPYYLKPQQTIFIPTWPGNGPNVYEVELGDTLSVIAERCKLPVTMLAKTNCLAPEAALYEPAGSTVELADGTTTTLLQETVVVEYLVIPVPPFPPPSRYKYPTGPIPIVPPSSPYPVHNNSPCW